MGRKAAKHVGDRELDRQQAFGDLADKYWAPYLPEMLAADASLALQQDKQGAEARERIYSRLFGRPVEMSRIDKREAIRVVIYPVERVGELPPAVEGEDNAQLDSPTMADASEGEYVLLPERTQTSA